MIYSIRLTLYLILLFNICQPEQINFKILSYNIFGLPEIFSCNNNSNRIKKIFDESTNFDIILFQENWDYQKYLNDYFNNFNQIISQKTKFIIKDNCKRSSGLNMIISKHILIDSYDEVMFSRCNGWFSNANDCLVSKGFLYSNLKFDDVNIHLYVTHLDAGNSKKDILARNHQVIELINHINLVGSQNPIILCGDFNIDYYINSDSINDFLYKTDFEIVKWDNKSKKEEMIDYIFYRQGEEYKINVIDCKIYQTLIDYSDHYPIECNISIDR